MPPPKQKSSLEKVIDEVQTLPPTRDITIDEDNIFLLYASFCGDVERTAHAAGVTPNEVLDLAAKHEWNAKLRGILELKKSGRPGDVERAVNRAINFVQAHRLRKFLERMLSYMCSLDADDASELMVIYSFDHMGNKTKRFNTRPFTDLAAAIEKCHSMTYLALGDSSVERKGREAEPEDGDTGGELHAKIAKAMSQQSPSPSSTREAKIPSGLSDAFGPTR